MTPTASELADALERSAIELEGFYSSRPDADTAPRFADTLRQSVAALRQVEVMREALEPFARFADGLTDECPDFISLGIFAGGAMSFGPGACNVGALRIARQALTGEA